MPRLLDLYSGLWGWSRAFAARGWECVGIDLTVPPEIPEGCTFIQADILNLQYDNSLGFYLSNGPILGFFDFVCASSPCEQFSIFGLPHFHPKPPYPELGIQLFNHTRFICEASGVPYLMENVRPARDFVGRPQGHCGPFYMWGSGVPTLVPQGITKGVSMGSGNRIKGMTKEQKHAYRKQFPAMQVGGKSKQRASFTSKWATIPLELSSCVCDYAEALLQQRQVTA